MRLASRRRGVTPDDPRRLRAQHLVDRLGPDAHATAAAGGLQDSAPRSALLSLHARMDGVEPSSWEHPSLAQIWFRWADYVVPRADLGIFTRGAMPRDPAAARALEAFADRVVALLDGDAWRTRDVNDALGSDRAGTMLRMANVTGRYAIRWDASSILVFPIDCPDVDDEEARIALARRFLDWYGPATVHDFARWAGVTRDDAAATWQGVDHRHARRGLVAMRNVRLLPQGDPWLQLHTDPPRTTPPPDIPTKVRNALHMGRILLDGEPVGAWARSQGDVTLDAWEPLDDDDRQRIDDEAASFTGPLGRPVRTQWVS